MSMLAFAFPEICGIMLKKRREEYSLRLDTKCSLALHCLIIIHLGPPKTKVTSELLSASTGSNPVIIRNILSALKKNGIISVARGVGGANLLVPAEKLSVWDEGRHSVFIGDRVYVDGQWLEPHWSALATSHPW